MLEPGALVAENYEIEALLGRGGFSNVYRARDRNRDRLVALKVMHPEAPGSAPARRQRFLQEAQLVARLSHRVNVALYDFGVMSQDVLYMAMELVEGETLEQRLRGGPVSPLLMVRTLRQVLHGLQEAHELGVLHRDVKPANIMLYTHVGEHSLVKLLDFGLARSLYSPQRLTQAGTAVGTVEYMAPEQLRGKELTPACDIYALGLVAYELIVGRHPVATKDQASVIKAQLVPQSFALPVDARLAEPLRVIVDRMLAKDVEARYRSAAEVAQDIEAALEELLCGGDPAGETVRDLRVDSTESATLRNAYNPFASSDDEDTPQSDVTTNRMLSPFPRRSDERPTAKLAALGGSGVDESSYDTRPMEAPDFDKAQPNDDDDVRESGEPNTPRVDDAAREARELFPTPTEDSDLSNGSSETLDLWVPDEDEDESSVQEIVAEPL